MSDTTTGLPYDLAAPQYRNQADPATMPSTGLPYYLASPENRPYADPATMPQSLFNDPYGMSVLSRQYGMDQALNAGMIGAGPQFALNQNTRDALASQIGYANAQYGLDQSALQNQTQYQLAQLGLDTGKLDVQRGALSRQGPLQDLLHSINQGESDLSRTSAWQQADVANRQAQSSAIARGANTSIGYNEQLGDIRNQLANQLKGLDYSSLREGAQYGETKSSLEDQNKLLDIQAQGLGIDRNHLQDQLQLGLQRLGIQNADAVSQLLDKMNSSSIQDQILAQQVFNQAIQNSDYYAQFYPVPVQRSPMPQPQGSTASPGAVRRQ